MRHFVGRRRALREGLSCSPLVLRSVGGATLFVTEASRLHVIFYVKLVMFCVEIELRFFCYSSLDIITVRSPFYVRNS